MLATNVTKSKKSPIKIRRKTSAAHKLRSVRLVLKGASTVETARKYGDSQRAVSNWVRRFKSGGADALNEAPRSGRPTKLTSHQLRQLEKFAARARAKSLKISGPVLAEFIKHEFGLSLTRQLVWRIRRKLR